MKSRVLTVATAISLGLLVVCQGGPALGSQNGDEGVIDAYIAHQAKRERGEEYREARKTTVGDLTHDDTAETVVLYTIEGQRGTNLSVQYLAVFGRHNGMLTPITFTAMGSKSVGSVDLKSVADEQIVLTTLSYGPKDAACCPSVPGGLRYVLVGSTLHVAKPAPSTARQD